MTTEQDIAQFIVSTVAANPNIRGASLGAKVKRQFPGVVFGKLTEFINRHCSNSVIALDKVNLDYVWAIKQDNNPPTVQLASSPTSVLKLQKTPADLNQESGSFTAWKVFTRFDTMRKIAVNPNTAQIAVLLTNDDVPQHFIEIPSVSQSEYQNIALEFTNQMPEPDRQHFKQIAENTSFESQWYETVSSWQNGLYAKTWGTFRFEALCSIFIKRLVAKGVAESLIGPCLENLKRLKAKVAKENTIPAFASAHIRPSSGSKLSIQDIVGDAVKSLNEDDLRRVWLPVGVVLDAIRRK